MKKTVFKPIYLAENGGLGNALCLALSEATHELVARMDSDDISYPDRFEKQLKAFQSDNSLDIVGGEITEFIGEETNISGKRTVMETDAQIKRDMKKRCPMNHVSVMYKKSAVAEAGGYLDWRWNEDYYLWIRMQLSGAKFANVLSPAVNVRVGDAMSARRGGMAYFKSEAGLQKFMRKNKMISFPRYIYNNTIRFLGEVVATNGIRRMLFKLVRKKHKPEESAKLAVRDFPSESQTTHAPFSVAMSVYRNDKPEWFDRALESILVKQSVKPDELVLVVDGPIPDELRAVIDKYVEICK